MISTVPWVFDGGATLEASKQAENYYTTKRDIADAMSKRYYYSSFELDWSLLTNAAVAGEMTYTFTAPWSYEIVGVELAAYSAATGTATLTISGGVTGAETTVATFAGSTTRALAQSSFVAPASGSVSYTLTVSPAVFTLDSCKAIIHIRTDRGRAGTSYQLPDGTLPPAYGNETNQTSLGTVYTDLGTSVSHNTAATNKPTIQVFTSRAIAGGAAIPASDKDLPIAAYGVTRRMQRIQLGCTVANTSTLVASVRDNAAATTAISVTVTGAGATTLTTGTTTSTATIGPQLTTDPVIRIDRGTGTDACLFAYAVVFWS